MVTTRRSFDESNTTVRSRSNVAVLDREIPVENEVKKTSTVSQDKERMQRNLDMLLNYDRYQQEEKAREEALAVAQTTSFADEDINPSSTTMQFGVESDLDREEIASDMTRAAAVETTRDYKLTKKGKIVIALYSLAVAIILALIIINTGVLALLKPQQNGKMQELSQIEQEYLQLKENIDHISTDEYISDKAIELGMSK